MAEEVWGLLEKSQVDNETIEQAIDRLITAHLADAGAHALAAESLKVHKDQVVVDHPADSIITDKIKDVNITNPKLQQRVRGFTAIVDAAGNYDYTNIQNAINYVNGLGGGKILVLPGTYTRTDDLILYNDIALIGLKASECIIDFDNNKKFIKVIGDTGVYNAGTISIDQGSKTVVGVGTAFVANVAVGEFILINDVLYEIESVDDNTHLTLVTRYGGEFNDDGDIDLAGINYQIAAYKKNIIIQDLQIIKGGIEEGITGEGAIHFEFVKDSVIRRCIVNQSRSEGISINDFCDNITLDENNVSDNTDEGIHLNDLMHSTIKNNISNNASVQGIFAASGVDHNLFYNNHCDHNNQGGMIIYGDDNVIIGNQCNNNDNDGIAIKSNGNHNLIIGNVANGNHHRGIYIESDRNVIKGNTCNDNGTDGIRIVKTYNTIVGNMCYNNGEDGIKIYGTAGEVTTDYNIVSSNVCTGNTGWGININHANNDKTIVIGNQLLGNGGGALQDLGTNTDAGHNIVA